jgi:hypothetical protein
MGLPRLWKNCFVGRGLGYEGVAIFVAVRGRGGRQQCVTTIHVIFFLKLEAEEGANFLSHTVTVGYESLLLYINCVLNQSLLNPRIVRLLVITIEH